MAMPIAEPVRRPGRLQLWCWALAATVAAVTLGIASLDRPLARLANAAFGGLPIDGAFVGTPGLAVPLAVLALALIGARRMARRPFGRADVAFLLMAVSLVLSDTVKSVVKYACGRTWPKYGSPSFLRDGAYGFHPFHGGGYESFPSGHMAAACAVAVVLWLIYPRLRGLAAAGSVALGAGLVALDYHFLSDVIAGGFLGGSVGLAVVSAWELAERRFPRPRRLRRGN